jgi:hypothetical protein
MLHHRILPKRRTPLPCCARAANGHAAAAPPSEAIFVVRCGFPFDSSRRRLCACNRGDDITVAFLLFLLPKPSDEAEQRQQMVPRALRSSRSFLGG